jgi:hypothetical protein
MAVREWILTVRNGSDVKRTRFQALDAALDALEEQIDELAPQAKRDAVEIGKRRFDAARLVSVRAELAGPGAGLLGAVHGGIDLRGDGSAEAYTGKLRRSLVTLEEGESACAGLRRVLRG